VKVRCLASFAARDSDRFARLSRHLRGLTRTGSVEVWSPADLRAGDDHAAEIDRRLAQADLVLLLVTASFLASDWTYALMMKALDRAITRAARVVPVIATACAWRATPLGGLVALPTNGKPITAWSDREAALCDVSSGLARVVTELGA
jgi:hypothetical protein